MDAAAKLLRKLVCTNHSCMCQTVKFEQILFPIWISGIDIAACDKLIQSKILNGDTRLCIGFARLIQLIFTHFKSSFPCNFSQTFLF